MAEALMKYYLKEKDIDKISVASYGLNVNPFDNVTEPKTLAALREIKIPIRSKKSKQINQKIINSADYVIVMTARQKAVLPYENVYTMDELTRSGEIPDPYGGSQEAYDLTAFKLKLAVETLIEKLIEKNNRDA